MANDDSEAKDPFSPPPSSSSPAAASPGSETAGEDPRPTLPSGRGAGPGRRRWRRGATRRGSGRPRVEGPGSAGSAQAKGVRVCVCACWRGAAASSKTPHHRTCRAARTRNDASSTLVNAETAPSYVGRRTAERSRLSSAAAAPSVGRPILLLQGARRQAAREAGGGNGKEAGRAESKHTPVDARGAAHSTACPYLGRADLQRGVRGAIKGLFYSTEGHGASPSLNARRAV